MSGYKEYRSVSEFPLHLQKLNREELEVAYQDLRSTYSSLVKSRGQLARRQTEAKKNLAEMNQKMQHLNATLARVQQEKQLLQQALAHSEDVRRQLDNWGKDLTLQVDDLQSQMTATAKLLGEFEAVYEDVREETGLFSIWSRFQRLLMAAHRLLNTDIKTLVPQNRPEPVQEDWTQETPANINRSLLDDR